jgi:hypothetical protein
MGKQPRTNQCPNGIRRAALCPSLHFSIRAIDASTQKQKGHEGVLCPCAGIEFFI